MNRRFIITAVAAFLILMVGFPALIRLTADWYWYQSLEFQTVFLKTVGAKLMLGLGAGLAAFLFLYANLWFAQRGVIPHPLIVSVGPKPLVDVTRVIRRLAVPIALFFAFVMG